MNFFQLVGAGFAFTLGMELAIGLGNAIGRVMRKRGGKK